MREIDLVSLSPSPSLDAVAPRHTVLTAHSHVGIAPFLIQLCSCVLPQMGDLPSLGDPLVYMAAASVLIIIWRAFSTKAAGLENQLARQKDGQLRGQAPTTSGRCAGDVVKGGRTR